MGEQAEKRGRICSLFAQSRRLGEGMLTLRIVGGLGLLFHEGPMNETPAFPVEVRGDCNSQQPAAGENTDSPAEASKSDKTINSATHAPPRDYFKYNFPCNISSPCAPPIVPLLGGSEEKTYPFKPDSNVKSH